MGRCVSALALGGLPVGHLVLFLYKTYTIAFYELTLLRIIAIDLALLIALLLEPSGNYCCLCAMLQVDCNVLNQCTLLFVSTLERGYHGMVFW